MFPEAMPVRKLRKCLHCPRFFKSSSAAERVCPKCRRKHTKLLEKHSGVVTFESTPQMVAHIRHMEEITDFGEIMSLEKIEAFLSGDDSIDDSAVYIAIRKEEKKTQTASGTKTGAVFILETLIKECPSAKTKKVRAIEHIQF